ncbi:TSUP family transporter [Reyranella sp. CPCC 100927]|uniref:TSUP family transporter n=1 Tax=Reyranella sp. CPCC 100927 TaxID=2599616 RepID=UPI0011B3F386|nr:TSUP family transporter [Reyranella sp. CPCC 100927]TWT08849.1 TSUP family transporter [Reyranella sp. CPCC 100927]
MSALVISGLVVLMTATAFLSGIFGMAGGLILIGALLALMPLPAAMALHAITQMSANGWRAILWRRHVVWRLLGFYALGCLAAVMLWSAVFFVPEKALALICLGLTPFAARMMPSGLQPDPARASHGFAHGVICMSLMLLTGVTGPLLDTFFLGAKGTDRRGVVATKAVAQVLGHALKLLYFGGLMAGAAGLDPILVAVAVAASMLGTTLSRRILEAMSDRQFRLWSGRLITAIATVYLVQGGWLLVAR